MKKETKEKNNQKKNKKKIDLENIAIALDEISVSLKSIALLLETNQSMPLNNQDHQLYQGIASIMYVGNQLKEATHESECNMPVDHLLVMKDPVKLDVEEKYEDARIALTDFLATIHINFQHSQKKLIIDNDLDTIANLFGRKYNELSPLMNNIKGNIEKRTSFSLCLKNYAQSTVGIICQAALCLLNTSLLAEYVYRKSPSFLLTARPNTGEAVRDFFCGEWLERYLVSITRKVIRNLADELKRPVCFHIFEQSRITLPKNSIIDLDLVIKINDIFYWVTYQSGSYRRNIAHHALFINKQRFDYGNAYVVIGEFQENEPSSTDKSTSMPVHSLSNFETCFKERLRKQILRKVR